MERREFIAALATLHLAAKLNGQTRDGMIYRKLGTTGERVSAIGLGGYHIGVPKTESESIRLIRSAIDRGITFLDNCWDYHEAASEIRMGKALRDGYRQKVFLMTKFDGRTREVGRAKQIDESLKRLQMDTIDLMQFHENIRMEDPDRFFAHGGALEAVLAAKKAGKIRYIGFTGHKDPVVHLRMLDVAAQHKFHFDSCADAAQRAGLSLPQLRARGGAEAGEGGDRSAGHEADGRRQYTAEPEWPRRSSACIMR